jgi:hypothetical protein
MESQMQQPTLRLYIDRLGGSVRTPALGEANRAIYLADGHAVIRGAGTAASLAPNSAWQGRAAIGITASPAGARLLRWELSTGGPALLRGDGVHSELALESTLRLEPGVGYLMRCDRVDFPPGGVAFTHTHQGPGIRCLQEGRIRIRTQGEDFQVDPHGAWFETGVDPVYAETRADGPSHFIRLMILPRAIEGRSSIRYVRPEDQDRPKTQTYQVFLDEPIEL